MFGAQKVLWVTGRAALGTAREATDRNMMAERYVERPRDQRSREQVGYRMGWVQWAVVGWKMAVLLSFAGATCATFLADPGVAANG